MPSGCSNANESAKQLPSTQCDGSASGCAEPPAPSCTLKSETKAHSPANRQRIKIGVGEDVTLTYSPGSAKWTKTGGGTLSPASGPTSKFSAGDKAENVTITATGSGGSCSITFNIVVPSNWTMQKQPGTNLKHKHGRPDCGWKGIMYVHPNDVNFYNIETREKDSKYVGNGSYSSFNGDYHGNYPPPDRVSDWFLITRHSDTDGSTDDAPDTIYTGLPSIADTGAAPPFKVGSGYFPITIQWRVVGSSDVHDFSSVTQEDEIFSNGRCESRKGGHKEQTMYDDPTSTY